MQKSQASAAYFTVVLRHRNTSTEIPKQGSIPSCSDQPEEAKDQMTPIAQREADSKLPQLART
eukprot:7428954-Heterocapsa_arctica.AAC.1